ncbi:unnamed protein product [Mytilus edulis]|uniref:Uncharacterized protein n=1 Tax=Mytilus edulis TaxID=6550 RepID=A0A8S3QZY0_MYTED|nr:unnamed protein product [Mytilus edulis]
MSNQHSENPDNDKMAGSYVLALKQNNNNFSKDNAEPDGEYFSVKPVFILESDIFGNSKPDKNNYLTHTELFRCIDLTIPANHLNGLQRVIGSVWRIYPDNEKDRDTLVVNSITIRKKRIEVYPRNPKYVEKEHPTTVRIRIKNIPLSADDDHFFKTAHNKLNIEYILIINGNIKKVVKHLLLHQNKDTIQKTTIDSLIAVIKEKAIGYAKIPETHIRTIDDIESLHPKTRANELQTRNSVLMSAAS